MKYVSLRVAKSSQVSVVVLGLLALCVPSARGQTNVPAGLINADTVWTASGSPYFLDGNILVAPGTTLTIEPGVEVHFQLAELGVSGRLIARGTVSDGISFLDDAERGKVHFSGDASDDSILSFCSFELVNLEAERTFPLVEFCSFGLDAGVLKFSGSLAPKVTIRDCSFTDQTNLEIDGVATLVFERNISSRRFEVHRASDIRIQDNTIILPSPLNDALIVSGSPGSIEGVISGNVVVGREVSIRGFVGQVMHNRFSIDRLRLHGTGGTWLRNTFVFNYAGHEGVEIENIAGFMVFNDNNFTPFPNLANDESILLVKAGFGTVINAEMNWWSTSDATSIEDVIDHFLDNGEAPFVDFVPFRTKPVGICTGDADCPDDGIFCNGQELCFDGICESAGDPCLPDEFCNEAIRACDQCREDEHCDNTIFCDGIETCDAGACESGPLVNCNDGVECTFDHCDESNRQCKHAPVNMRCDDEDFCNGTETCDVLQGCIPGEEVDCNDRIECTVDSCDDKTASCVNDPNNDRCDNDLFCDGVENCEAGVGCVPGTAPNCDDDVECTVDTCDEEANQCRHNPDDGLCNDNLFCAGWPDSPTLRCVPPPADPKTSSCVPSLTACYKTSGRIEPVSISRPSDRLR